MSVPAWAREQLPLAQRTLPLRLGRSISNMELELKLALALAFFLMPLEAHVRMSSDNNQLALNTFYWRHQVGTIRWKSQRGNFPKSALRIAR